MKFTKASKKDKTLTTVSLNELKEAGVELIDFEGVDYSPTDLHQGDEFILTVDGVKTVFRANRTGKTATTKAFPRHLKLPTVGKPVSVEIELEATLLSDLR